MSDFDLCQLGLKKCFLLFMESLLNVIKLFSFKLSTGETCLICATGIVRVKSISILCSLCCRMICQFQNKKPFFLLNQFRLSLLISWQLEREIWYHLGQWHVVRDHVPWPEHVMPRDGMLAPSQVVSSWRFPKGRNWSNNKNNLYCGISTSFALHLIMMNLEWFGWSHHHRFLLSDK